MVATTASLRPPKIWRRPRHSVNVLRVLPFSRWVRRRPSRHPNRTVAISPTIRATPAPEQRALLRRPASARSTIPSVTLPRPPAADPPPRTRGCRHLPGASARDAHARYRGLGTPQPVGYRTRPLLPANVWRLLRGRCDSTQTKPRRRCVSPAPTHRGGCRAGVASTAHAKSQRRHSR